MVKDIDKFDDGIDFDEIDKLLAEDDFENTTIPDNKDTQSTKNRKPIEHATEASVALLKNAAKQTSSSIKDSLKQTLPNTFNRIDEIKDVVSGVNDLKTELTKEVSNTLNTFRAATNRLLPIYKNQLPKFLVDKLESFGSKVREETKNSYHASTSELVKSELSEFLEKQADLEKTKEQVNMTNTAIDRRITMSTYKGTIAYLSSIREESIFQSRFLKQIASTYMRKSLELKVEHVLISKDILNTLKTTTQILHSRLDEIRHNTSLPDIVKKQKLEHLKSLVMGSLPQTFGAFKGQLGKKIVANIKNSILGTSKDIVSAIGTAVDMQSQMLQMESDTGNKLSIAQLIGGTTGKLLVSLFGAPRMKAMLQTLSPYTDNIEGMTSYGKEWLLNKASSIKNKNPNSLVGSLLSLVPDYKTKHTVENTLLTKGNEEVNFDLATRQTIVEIIPGWFSKIHQVLKSIYKGSDQEAETYNIFQRKFTSQSVLRENISTHLLSDDESKSYKLSSLIGDLKGGYKLRGNSVSEEDFNSVIKDVNQIFLNLVSYKYLITDEILEILNKVTAGDLDSIDNTYFKKIYRNVNNPQKASTIILQSLFNKNNVLNVDVLRTINVQLSSMFTDDNYLEKIPVLANVFGLKSHMGDFLSSTKDSSMVVRTDKISKNLNNFNIDDEFLKNINDKSDYSYKNYEKAILGRKELYDNFYNTTIGEFFINKVAPQISEKFTQLKNKLNNVENDIKKIDKKSVEDKYNKFFGIKKKEKTYDEIKAQELASKRKLAEKNEEYYIDDEEDSIISSGKSMPIGSGFKETYSSQKSGRIVNASLKMPKEYLRKLTEQYNVSNNTLTSVKNIETTTSIIANSIEALKETQVKHSEKIISSFSILEKLMSLQIGKHIPNFNLEENFDKFKNMLSEQYQNLDLKTKKDGIKSKSKEVLKTILGGYGQFVKSSFALTGSLFGLGGKAIDSLGNTLFGRQREKYYDVYLKDSIELGYPLLSTRQQVDGVYLASTSKLLEKTDDITSPIIDEDGNTLITEEDIKHGLVDVKNKPIGKSSSSLLGTAIGGVGSYIKKGLELNLKFAALPIKFAEKLIEGIGVKKHKEKYFDVYLKDKIELGNPILSVRRQVNGVYLVSTNGLLEKTYDIDGPVIDANGNAIITEEDFNHGLVDVNNVEFLKNKGLFSLSGLKDKFGIGKGIKGILGMYGKMFDFSMDIARGVGKRAGSLFDKIFGLNTEERYKDNKEVLEETLGKRLDKIYDLLDKRLSKKIQGDLDGDGLREGSVEEFLKKQKEKKSKNKEKPSSKKDSTKKGISKSKDDDGKSSDYKALLKKVFAGAGIAGIALGVAGNAAKAANTASDVKQVLEDINNKDVFNELTNLRLNQYGIPGFSKSDGAYNALRQLEVVVADSANGKDAVDSNKFSFSLIIEFAKKWCNFHIDDKDFKKIDRVDMDYVNALNYSGMPVSPFDFGKDISKKQETSSAFDKKFDKNDISENTSQKLSYLNLWFTGRFTKVLFTYREVAQSLGIEFNQYDGIEIYETLGTKEEPLNKVQGLAKKFNETISKHTKEIYALELSNKAFENFTKAKQENEGKDLSQYKDKGDELSSSVTQNSIKALSLMSDTGAQFNASGRDESLIRKMSSEGTNASDYSSKTYIDKGTSANWNQNLPAIDDKLNALYGGGSGDYSDMSGGKIRTSKKVPIDDIGYLSAPYESNGNPATVANNRGDKGGTSYGTYQLASRTGTFLEFVRWCLKHSDPEIKQIGERLAATLRGGNGHNNPATIREWKTLATDEKLGKALQKAEKEFIVTTHYDAALRRIKEASPEAASMIENSRTLRQALYSTAVQHGAGGARNVFMDAYSKLKEKTVENFLKNIYAERGDLKKRFKSTTDPGILNGLTKRFKDELATALDAYKKESNNFNESETTPTSTDTSSPTSTAAGDAVAASSSASKSASGGNGSSITPNITTSPTTPTTSSSNATDTSISDGNSTSPAGASTTPASNSTTTPTTNTSSSNELLTVMQQLLQVTVQMQKSMDSVNTNTKITAEKDTNVNVTVPPNQTKNNQTIVATSNQKQQTSQSNPKTLPISTEKQTPAKSSRKRRARDWGHNPSDWDDDGNLL